MLLGRLASGGSRSFVQAPCALRRGINTMSATAAPPLLLSPSSLASLLEEGKSTKKKPRILDATWFMPGVPRDARQEFEKGPRLPGASFWDVDDVADKTHPLGLKHMMPSSQTFAEAASSQGIENDTHVVVYDTHGVFSSPRTAFTFHAFGHRNISILDGGLPAWIAASLPLEPEGSAPSFDPSSAASTTPYQASKIAQGIIRDYDEMIANARMGSRGQTVLDARSLARFEGSAPEPRAGLSSGHIPNSLSLPFSDLLLKDEKTGVTTFKPQTDLWRTISDAVGGLDGIDKIRQASSAGETAVTATCGSGMTAAVIWAALHQLGIQASIYDESWTGYAQRKESPIDKTVES